VQIDPDAPMIHPIIIDSDGKTQKLGKIPLFDARLMRKYGVSRKVAADPLYQTAAIKLFKEKLNE
jgi:hypothetical protein